MGNDSLLGAGTFEKEGGLGVKMMGYEKKLVDGKRLNEWLL